MAAMIAAVLLLAVVGFAVRTLVHLSRRARASKTARRVHRPLQPRTSDPTNSSGRPQFSAAPQCRPCIDTKHKHEQLQSLLSLGQWQRSRGWLSRVAGMEPQPQLPAHGRLHGCSQLSLCLAVIFCAVQSSGTHLNHTR